MAPTRRQFLQAGMGATTALAGCSVLTRPQESLLLAVNNYTDERHQGYVRIDRDDTEIVHQYVEIGAAGPDSWATVETKIPLGRMPSGAPLDVIATFDDELQATGQHTLDCTDQYTGRAVYVQIPNETPVTVELNLACYDEFPSSEAEQGGTNRS